MKGFRIFLIVCATIVAIGTLVSAYFDGRWTSSIGTCVAMMMLIFGVLLNKR